MPFQAIAQCVEVVLSAERSGEERKNIIHYKYPSGVLPDESEMHALAVEIGDHIINSQQILTCIGTNWIEIKVSEMSTAGGLVHTVPIFRSGLAAGGNLPGNSAHCLTKRTGFRGGTFRGRYYLFDMPESYFNGDDLELPILPWVTGLANELLFPRVGGRFVPVVGSKTIHAGTIINGITFDLVADSQRRRLKKRGR